MGEVQSSAPSDSQQKLAALAQRGSNADAVQTVSNMGLAINAAQVTAAGTSAWAAGTFQCFAGRVIAPLGGAMLGGALAEALGADRPVTWVLDKMGLPAVAKPGKAPARVGHKIVHENAFIGALTGLLAGIAVGVAIAAAAAAIVATGGAAAVAIAAAGPFVVGFVSGAVGGFVGAAVAKGIGHTGSVTGAIAHGSPNVSFEGAPVARVTDPVTCSKDPGMPPPQIAQGSLTVSVNGLPLARIGHKITCSAVIQEGCTTISADETTGTFGKIDANVSLLEQLVLTATDVIMMRSATKEGGLLDGVLRELLGEPIDMATGDYADYRTDFTWPHVLPLTLSRAYAGRQPVEGLLGDRWISNWSQRLRYRRPADGPATVTFFDADGQQLVYPVPHEPFNAINFWAPHYALHGSRARAVVFDERSQQSLIFEPAHAEDDVARLTRIEDRNGNTIDFEYNALGRLCTVRHSGGMTLWVTCDSRGLLQSVSEQPGGEGELVRYRFDGKRLTDVHNRFQGEFHFGYTDEGWLNHWRDSGATQVALRYDERGRVIATRTNTALYDDRFEYDDEARLTTYIDALGHRHQRWFDAQNRLIRSRDPLGRVMCASYDENGWLASRTDPLGRVSTYRHDCRGRPLQVTDAFGRVSRYGWNGAGQLVEQQDHNGKVQWHYSAEGNLVALRARSGETRFRYDARGLLVGRTDPDGAVHAWRYDGAGRPERWTDPLGRHTYLEHDRYGRLIARIDAAGHRTTYGYERGPSNPRELLASITYPDGAIARFQYDSEGLLTEAVNPLGQRTRYAWGAFDLLASVTDPGQATTRYHRDGAARLIGVTNAAGQHWKFERDPAGQLIAQTDWSGRRTRYVLNPMGQVTEKHLPDGVAIRYEYDSQDRLVALTGPRRRHVFAWTASGLLTRAEVWTRNDEAGEWRRDDRLDLEYDDACRLVEESQHGRAVGYEYDPMGRTRSMATPSGRTLWQYDAAGQLGSMESNGHRFHFDYDGLGLETLRRYTPTQAHVARHPQWVEPYSEGYAQQQDHDGRWRLTKQACATWAELRERGAARTRHYEWDAAGRCVGMHEARRGLPIAQDRWRYDARGQVVDAHYERTETRSGRERYEYDALGNVSTRQIDAGEAMTHVYHGDQLVSAGPSRYEYDARGRMIARTEGRDGFRPRTWRYQWDDFDQLEQVLTPEGERWRYRYDAFGRRISKACLSTPKAGRPARIDYLWCGSRLIEAWRAYGERDGTQYEIQRWHYRPGTHSVLAQERLKYDDKPDLQNSEWFALACDPNGAPHTLYSSDGRIMWSARRELWGRVADDPDRDTVRHAVREQLRTSLLTGDAFDPPDCELRFPGQWADEESGLHYNFHRYYDPATGQYLSPDPLGLAGGLRTHAYVHDPLQWVDPLGLQGYQGSGKPEFIGNRKLPQNDLPWIKYQKRVTGRPYEETWRVGDHNVNLDGKRAGYTVEAKWTGKNSAAWESSPYNPEHEFYNESKILDQAGRLLEFNDASGGSGVRYAVSNAEAQQHFTQLFEQHFPTEMQDGTLSVWHVPGNGM
ncbi:RHS repeat-associated core domain-containing protein [Burkholderia pseudomallei]|uniref:RHS repeat-associated core domain-containing protein n=1 Tax=Burkholderia pseudomallei TaxID=28450 RepID=UPI0022EA4FF5|nr:RHS repeat-associated core domain-containing protein [Burkholderia pseudomallei]